MSSLLRFLIFVFLCAHVSAQPASASPSASASFLPPIVAPDGEVGGATPVVVYVSVTPVQVAKIEASVQNMFIDAYVVFSWRDASVAECADGGSAALPMPEAWAAWGPAPVFLNSVAQWDGALALTQSYCGAPPGFAHSTSWVNFYGRISGSFVSEMRMRDFPSDAQNVTLRIESDSWDADALIFAPLPTEDAPSGLVENDNTLLLSGWTKQRRFFSVHRNFYPAFNATYSQAIFQLSIRRQPFYYYMRIVFNVVLMVAISLLSAAMSPADSQRFALPLTIFMGVVSWVFVIVFDAPKSDELTRLDVFFTLTFVALFVQVAYYAAAIVLDEPSTSHLPNTVVGRVRAAFVGGAGKSGRAGKEERASTTLRRKVYENDAIYADVTADGGFAGGGRGEGGRGSAGDLERDDDDDPEAAFYRALWKRGYAPVRIDTSAGRREARSVSCALMVAYTAAVVGVFAAPSARY